ncbi:MAG: TetR/AcrR family transcriptional regulator [Oleiphilaceae bacterium]|nr:TetR/AcrR family transcriptional regulator [Oleiphilaceae bacterium]
MSQTKRDILSAALQCFMSKGVEQTTISDIREASGISVGSIYHHFGNKDGIVVALFLTGMQDHSAQQESALGQCDSAEEGVKTIVRCYIDWICHHPDWARFVFRYRSLVENSALSEQNEEHKRAHFRRLKAWFTPHIESGQIQKLPFEVYHSLIIGPAQDFALRWLAGKTRGNLGDYRELYAEAAWQAIKT